MIQKEKKFWDGDRMRKNINKMVFLNKLPLFIFLWSFMFTLISFVSTYKEYLEVKTVANEFANRLTEVFFDNENIAHAISSKYFELLNSGCSDSISDRKPLGLSIYTGLSKGSNEFNCLNSALEFINKKSANVIAKNHKERYFFSPELNLLYFFSKDIPADLNYKELNILNENKIFKYNTPDYYERMLSKDVKKKGFSSTEIYNDIVTGEKVYTLISYAFAIDKEKVIGYVYYNHSQSELKYNLISFMKLQPQPQPWISASIINRLNGAEICFYGNCKNRDITYKEDYSDLYELLISINIFQYLKYNTVTQVTLISMTFFSLILFFMNIRLRSNEYIRSITDPLTKTFLRKAIKHIIPNKNSGFILFDVNKFKYINDNFGHHAGDKALKKIADLIKECINKNDVLIRLGGDEYLAYIPSTSQEGLKKLAEKITYLIEGNPLEFGNHTIKLSVSHGVSLFDETIENTLKVADFEMYKQKKSR